MSKQKKTSFEKAKDFIIKAGFSHIKIELEGDLYRDDEEVECVDCYGSGYVTCHECEGSGVVEVEDRFGNTESYECGECEGSGEITCETCDGEGSVYGRSWDLESCHEFILNRVPVKARDVLNYSEFYRDGSVDSEMTLTLPVEYADYLVDYIQAFKDLSEEIGNGLDTSGAGMHITVIPKESNGYYPCSSNTLDEDKYNNFRTNVKRLLPALYMLASPNSISRRLNYREPAISATEKYSAIYSKRCSSLEYRLFETCYDDPEMVKEYIEVIANTLKFYDDKTLSVPERGVSFGMPDYSSTKVSRFYDNENKIRILKEQLKILKPANTTIKELMDLRDVPNITKFKKLESDRIKRRKMEWKRISDRNKELLSLPLDDYKLNRYNNALDAGYSEDEAKAYAHNISSLPKLSDYIKLNKSYDYSFSL